MLTLLLESKPQPTLTLRIPLSKQLALKKVPSTTSTDMQKNIKDTESYKYTQTHPNSPILRLLYLSNYHDALQAHMHLLYKLGNANIIANYHENYQTHIKKPT